MSRVVLVAVIAWVGACVDERRVAGHEELQTVPWPGVVSDPVAVGSMTTAGGALGSLSGADVVYISLAPSTIPGGEVASIRNRDTGSGIVAAMVAGGLDPVPVPASAGDTLDIAVRLAGSHSTLHFVHAVAAARRPIVVRTDPPPRKRDVPLNAVMLVVFNEPIDPTTLTGATVQLVQGSTSVTGQLEFRDPANFTAAFVPAPPLAASTDYRLEVTQGIRDLDGEALEAPVTVEFTTEPPGGAATQLAFTVQPANAFTGVAIEPAIQVTARDASGSTATTFVGDVSIAIGANPAGGSLSGTTTVAVVAGVAAFDDLRITAPGAGYTLLATASGLDGDTSAAFDVITVGPGRIAFNRNGGGDASDLWVMNADGTGETRLAFGQTPAWSPDGTKLAFTGGVMNADGSGLSTLNGRLGLSPVWSPDGSKIAFLRDLDGHGAYGVYVINADGTDVSSRLTEAMCCRIAWAPGTSIAFASDRDGRPRVYVMNADGSGVTSLTNEPGYSSWDPAWSPNGTKIAFVRMPYDYPELPWGMQGGPYHLHVMNADGSGVTRVTTTYLGGWLGWPTWSPDGQRIAFASNHPSEPCGCGNASLYVINVDGSGLTRITFGYPGNREQPAWSRGRP